jgi:hypothetical protein
MHLGSLQTSDQESTEEIFWQRRKRSRRTRGQDGVWGWPKRDELRGMEARDLEGDERRRRRG